MIRFDVITLFPQVFKEHFNTLPFNRALKEGIAKINIQNLRDYALDSYGTVDDKPYGGGKGMILRPEPVVNALVDIYIDYFDLEAKPETEKGILKLLEKAKKDKNIRIIALTPRGKEYTQETAQKLTGNAQITIICGRYEGIDARIEENIATDLISIGKYVLAGGEIPALAVMDSVLRLKDGILDPEALESESFTDGYLENPQYTRPEKYLGIEVPKVLISGNHKEIEKWKNRNKEKIAQNLKN